LVNLSDVCQQCVTRWILNGEDLVTGKVVNDEAISHHLPEAILEVFILSHYNLVV